VINPEKSDSLTSIAFKIEHIVTEFPSATEPVCWLNSQSQYQ
jgi:hypothetical protein